MQIQRRFGARATGRLTNLLKLRLDYWNIFVANDLFHYNQIQLGHADLLIDDDCPRIALHSDSDARGAYLPIERTPSPSGILRAYALGRAERLLGGRRGSWRRLCLALIGLSLSLALGTVGERLLTRFAVLVL